MAIPAFSFFIYLFVGGMIHTLGAILIVPLFLFLARHFCGTPYDKLFSIYLVFNVCLLFWSCVGNSVFMSFAYNRLYVSADTVVDWFPFIPFGQWVLDQTMGNERSYLIGDTTLWEMRLVWFAVAAPVWLLAYASTVRVLARRPLSIP